MTRARGRRRRRAPLLLLLLCCALIGFIYVEAERPDVEPPANAAVAPPRAPEARAASAPTFVMPPLRDYAEVLERPLFSPTRRRPPADTGAADPRSAPFTLVGVVLSASGKHALIEHAQPRRLDRVVEGQTLDGWMVEEIRLDRVVFRRGDTRIEVKPKDKAPPANRPHPANAAPAAAPVNPNPLVGVFGLPPQGGAQQ